MIVKIEDLISQCDHSNLLMYVVKFSTVSAFVGNHTVPFGKCTEMKEGKINWKTTSRSYSFPYAVAKS